VSFAATLRAPLRARRQKARAKLALTPGQIQWLGALLLAVQLPQAPHLPIWVAVAGALLVILRLTLLYRDRQRPDTPPARIPSWTLVLFALAAVFAVRASFGYLVGRDPSVAFLYILVAIKFLETRNTRDGTLLVCLACFLFITPFFYSQSLLAALAMLPPVILVGACLDALASPARSGASQVPRMALLRRSGVMLLQGLPVAFLLFVLFPRLTGPLWGLPADASARTGLSDSMSPGQISELSLSDAPVFRVDFDGAVPPPRLRYWRGPVLSRFNGRTWSSAQLSPGGIPEAGAGAGISYTVSLEPTDKPWLFALELPSALPRLDSRAGSGAQNGEFAFLTRDQQLLARPLAQQALRYTATSVLRSSFPADPEVDAESNLRLPGGAERTLAFAHELRLTYPDNIAYIRAVLDWFNHEKFVYSLSAPQPEGDATDVFLFETRRGFCEHYASAFVVLLRAAGIPARVVTGYQGGEINPNGGYMIVRQSDAHAWAEALLDGRWQRFDPTAAVSPSRIEMGLGGALPTGEQVPFLARLDHSWLKSVELAWDAVNHDWRRNVIGFNYERQRSLWREWGLDNLAPWQIVAAAASFIFAWAGALAAWLMYRRRRQERALVLWGDLCRRLARAGLPRLPYEGPLAFAQRAAQRWPQFAIAFAAIGESFASLRYGRPATPRQRSALEATLERAIDVLPPPAALRR
jgi:protein-glutamine gamma-glutamyltransferase